MHVVVVSSTGRSAASRALVASLRRHHDDVTVTMLVTSPRSLVRGSVAGAPFVDATLIAPAVPAGRLRAADVTLGWGDAMGRLLAISTAAPGIAGDSPAVVLPEWAFVAGSLDGLLGDVGPDRVGLVPRISTTDGEVLSGGWIPEVMVVGGRAHEVLAAWASSMESWCLERADLVDPWSELLLAGGAVVAIDHPGLRLAPRSIAHLEVTEARGTTLVEGQPLAVASFPGFDPERPWWFAGPGEVPPISTSDHPALRALCRRYAALLAAAGMDESAERVSTDAVVGVPVTDAMRSGFRAACRSAVAEGAPAPANPFVSGEVQAFRLVDRPGRSRAHRHEPHGRRGVALAT